MTIGGVVDYCITYNEIMGAYKDEETTKKATQEDWDNLP